MSDTKWKVWFKVHRDKNWYTSSARFLTEDTAIEHAREKFSNWAQADSWVVVRVGFNPNEEDLDKHLKERENHEETK